MKKAFSLICVLLLWSPLSNAEWELIALGESNESYADWSTLRIAGTERRLWLVTNFDKAFQGATSSKSLVVFDCDDERYQRLQSMWYSEPMGSGAVIHTNAEPSDWRYAAPGTVGLARLRAVCERPAS